MWTEHLQGWKRAGKPESDQKKKSGYHHWKQEKCDIDWCLGSLPDLLIKPINLYAEEVQIGPIRQDKTVLSGSYGNKSLPTAIGKAGEQAGDMTPWCSKLGDYMLAAPLRLVLLRRPNCPAILSFLRSVVKAWWRGTLRYPVQLPLQQQLYHVDALKNKCGLLLSDITGM